MKRWQFLGMLLSFPIFLLGLVWQTGRQASLIVEAHDLEHQQEGWVEANSKLIGGIAVLQNRERADSLAAKLGLERATADRRIFIKIGPAENSDVGATTPLPSTTAPTALKGNGNG
ncbi:MAG TPA: hypothetical protein VMV83_14055 [Rectinemataceae bacterium]|nr:hypothetical protein [Rectinemataceae bacterium]